VLASVFPNFEHNESDSFTNKCGEMSAIEGVPAVLRLPDAILSPEALQAAGQFIASGAQNSAEEAKRRETAALSALVESYEGVPDALGLISKWGSVLSHSQAETESASEGPVLNDNDNDPVWGATASFVLEHFDARVADGMLAEVGTGLNSLPPPTPFFLSSSSIL
jgi:hypothetical protein